MSNVLLCDAVTMLMTLTMPMALTEPIADIGLMYWDIKLTDSPLYVVRHQCKKFLTAVQNQYIDYTPWGGFSPSKICSPVISNTMMSTRPQVSGKLQVPRHSLAVPQLAPALRQSLIPAPPSCMLCQQLPRVSTPRTLGKSCLIARMATTLSLAILFHLFLSAGETVRNGKSLPKSICSSRILLTY